MKLNTTWLPAVLLIMGTALTAGAGAQRSIALRAPLADVVPKTMLGLDGVDQTISETEQRVAGMDQYLLRNYSRAGAAATATTFSIYVGYYEKQARGQTIHSPKNCLPGAGWEALTSTTTMVATANGPVEVTKYLLKRKDERAVVLYWYQGRGRVEANEYRVKWNLLRDAAMRRRSDEALVRIVVPVTKTEDTALQVATRVAGSLIPDVSRALPL
jgi:EpsI family protein